MSGLLRTRELLRDVAPARSYDVVIVGGGGHGLATAYQLAARHGIRDVAVIERGYIGAGGSGRNTTVVRSNYIHPEAIAFYRASHEAYATLGAELDFNLLYTARGVLDVIHSEDGRMTERRRADVDALCGVETRFVTPAEIKQLCPVIDLDAGGRPIVGGSYHPAGAIARHDAVVWGYAAAATRLGVHIHQGVEVAGVMREGERCFGVETTAGPIRAGAVLSAVAGWTSQLAELAGIRVPIVTHPLQAFVTEPYKPVLDAILGSNDLFVYVSQSARGELLVGGELEPYQSYSSRSTLEFLSHASARCVELLPFMAPLRILRQWAGLCDLSPDSTPILDETELAGFYLSAGWGTGGFKAIPAGGAAMAELIATGRRPDLIAPFRLSRFRDERAVSERASAGTH
jgi:sarcosine oxidase, subunit beta